MYETQKNEPHAIRVEIRPRTNGSHAVTQQNERVRQSRKQLSLDSGQKGVISTTTLVYFYLLLVSVFVSLGLTPGIVLGFIVGHRILIPIICISILAILVAQRTRLAISTASLASFTFIALADASNIIKCNIDEMQASLKCAAGALIVTGAFFVILSLCHSRLLRSTVGILISYILAFIASFELISICTGASYEPIIGSSERVFALVAISLIYIVIVAMANELDDVILHV